MYIIPIILCALLIAIDQFTKYLAVEYLMPKFSVEVIHNFFSFTYVENKGAAFGFFEGAKWLFIIATVIVLIIGIVYYKKIIHDKGKILIKATIIMILAGAIGNAIDRVSRGYQ